MSRPARLSSDKREFRANFRRSRGDADVDIRAPSYLVTPCYYLI